MAQYDEVAETYESLIAPRYRPIAELVVERLPEGLRGVVVEPGIGTGLLASLALPRLNGCTEYVGVDVSPGMLAIARRRLPGWVTLVEASALDMPIEDEVADLLISSLGPVQESDAFFSESVRVLQKDASLILVCWGEGYRELDLLQRARTRIGAGTYPTGVEEAVLGRAGRAGLVEVEIETVHLPIIHGSMAEYLAYRGAFGTMPWLPEGTAQQWQQLVEEEAGRYLTETGEIALDWTLLVLSGRRGPGT